MTTGDPAMSRQNGLEPLRARLAAIDDRLLDTLRERIDCCVQIARHKREHQIPMMQPHRIELAHQRAARYAAEHGISAEFLRSLYELIITETCRVEDLVISGEPAPQDVDVACEPC